MSAKIKDLGDRLVILNGNAAKRGALTPAFYDCIAEAIERAAEPRIRAVILTSEGKFFCAGGDMNVLITRRTLSEPERRDKIDGLHDLVRAMRACPVPLIAAIEGGAAGAGMSLMLACDLIISSEAAMFTAAYVKAGLVPDAGLTSAMARMLPRPLAMELCLLGRPIAAVRLAELGVVNRLCSVGQAFETAQTYADIVAAGPREAQGAIRRLVADAYETEEAAQLDAERNAMAFAAGGDEAAEGIAAFLGKRKPNYGS